MIHSFESTIRESWLFDQLGAVKELRYCKKIRANDQTEIFNFNRLNLHTFRKLIASSFLRLRNVCKIFRQNNFRYSFKAIWSSLRILSSLKHKNKLLDCLMSKNPCLQHVFYLWHMSFSKNNQSLSAITFFIKKHRLPVPPTFQSKKLKFIDYLPGISVRVELGCNNISQMFPRLANYKIYERHGEFLERKCRSYS